MKRFFVLLILFCMLFSTALADDDEVEFSYAQLVSEPHVTIITPSVGQSYNEGGKLHVKASGEHVNSLMAVFAERGIEMTYPHLNVHLDK